MVLSKLDQGKFTRRSFLKALGIAVGAITLRPSRAQAELVMEKRRLGRTELMVCAIGFGTGNGARGYGGGGESYDDLAVRVLRRAIDMGVNFFDTASTIDYGRSEIRIGKAIKGYPRESLYIATKVEPSHTGWTREQARRSIEGSLERLDVEYIDVIQFHGVGSSDALRDILYYGRAMQEVERAKAQGLVRSIGITGGHNASELNVLVQAIKTNKFDTVMPSYNIEFRDAALPAGVFETAAKYDVGLIIKKAFTEQPWRGRWRSLIPQYGVERLLRFVLSDPRVSTVIPSMAHFPDMTWAECIAQVEEDVSVGLQRA